MPSTAPDPVPLTPWYGPLVEPVRPQLEAAWGRLPSGLDRGRRAPRAGLGGAIVIHVARGWGSRRWQEAGRVAVALVEAFNQRVFAGLPTADERAAWLAADVDGLARVGRRVFRRDQAILKRVADRFLLDPELGATPVPEAVLFLRGAVAVGVIVGDVPDAEHAALDAWAEGLGRVMERGRAVDDPKAAGCLAAARAAIEGLPACDAKERFSRMRPPDSPGASPSWTGWEPVRMDVGRPAEGALEVVMKGLLDGVAEGPLKDAGRWLRAQGGKRVRGRLSVAAAVAVGGDGEVALPIAAAIEWVHAASLVLDDIVDEAELRRGAPALHRVSSPPFAAGVAGWILTRVFTARPSLGEVMLDLAMGQRAELIATPDMDVGAWYAVATLKTARLFSAAVEEGGAAAGARKADRVALARFGTEVGLAFQIVDDLLDVIGDEVQLGKRPGQDVRSGRVTLPLLLLIEAEPGLQLADAGAVQAAMRAHGIAAACLERARRHRDRAIAAIQRLPGDTRQLQSLANLCVERQQ